jgi:hypothetical protein
MMFTVLAGMAEYEREFIRSRVQDKLDNKRQKNELTGTVPYGWDAAETGATTAKGVKVRELVPNLVEQSWILHMVTLRAQGWGYHSIANDLNSRDVPTKRGKGEIMNLRVGATSTSSETKRFTTHHRPLAGRQRAQSPQLQNRPRLACLSLGEQPVRLRRLPPVGGRNSRRNGGLFSDHARAISVDALAISLSLIRWPIRDLGRPC